MSLHSLDLSGNRSTVTDEVLIHLSPTLRRERRQRGGSLKLCSCARIVSCHQMNCHHGARP